MSYGYGQTPYSAQSGPSPPRGGAVPGVESVGINKVEDLEHKCSLWRYRCPLSEIRELEHVNSKYSDEFMVADTPWRIHLQQRSDPQTGVMYLAVHLQCVHTQPGGIYGHFKLTIINNEPERSKGKNFHCHFKKPGAAWGLHHFIQLDRLMSMDGGFIDRFDDASGPIPCVVIDVLLKVIDPGLDGTYVIGSLPKPSRAIYNKPTINAKLMWPPSDPLCDLTFALASGQTLQAHRCIIQARCPKILDTPNKQEEAEKCVVHLPNEMTKDVFELFLRFVYTEEGPESRAASAEVLIDLYRQAADAEYFSLAERCLTLATPLVTGHNVLTLISTRYQENDEPLNNLFLKVLVGDYDKLIEEEAFSAIPGPMHRKLSLLMRAKESLSDVRLPSESGRTLSNDLGSLLTADDTYADIDVILPQTGSALRLHKVVLFNRAVGCQKWISRADFEFPAEDDYQFTDDAYRAFFSALYRGTMEPTHAGDAVTPELIALTMKMDEVLQLTGELKKECDAYVNPRTCLPLYVLSRRHNVEPLASTSQGLLAKTFQEKLKTEGSDHVWQILEELEGVGIMSLFRAFAEHVCETQPGH